MPNIINPDAIGAYLSGFFPDDPISAKHLNLALGKALKKLDGATAEVTALPDDAPGWLKEKWPQGGPYHRFAPDDALRRRVKHVADWIGGAVAEGDAWLIDTDAQGRPKKLLKLGSLEQAEAEADKAMHLKNARKAARLVPDGEGEQTVMAMPDGYRIVQMTSETALDRESAFMGHCVGQGGYDRALRDGSRQFFSLRDAANKPHATFEVDPQRHALIQCKGKENKLPVAHYMPQVQAFLRDRKYRLEEAASQTGLIEQDGEYYDIMHLPKNFQYRGSLYLSGTPIAALPDGLRVGGGLYLSHTPIAALPEGLRVGGNLYLRHTPIAALPEGLRVGGDLYLTGTRISAIPESASVRGRIIGWDAPQGFAHAQRLAESRRAQHPAQRGAG